MLSHDARKIWQIFFELFIFSNILRAFRRVKYKENINNEKNIFAIFFKQECYNKFIISRIGFEHNILLFLQKRS